MNKSLTNIEFFAYEGEVWIKSDGDISRLTESNTEALDEMVETISTFYPKAYKALCDEYKGCVMNKSYFKYRLVCRFVKCNFAQLDNIPDVSADGHFEFEYVQCPLRGECRLDRVVCRPEFDHHLSAAEMPVMRLWYEGLTQEAIAAQLCLSPHTVNNHIRNAYRRLNVHTKGDFIKFANLSNLFR